MQKKTEEELHLIKCQEAQDLILAILKSPLTPPNFNSKKQIKTGNFRRYSPDEIPERNTDK